MSQNLVRTESTPVAPIDADRMVSASTADRLARAVPTETRRAYSGDWNRFNTWATDAGRTSMPATAETLAEYATHLADLGRAPGTIERAVAAIRKAHAVAEQVPPATDLARAVIRTAGADRADEGTTTRKAQALSVADLRAMLRHAAGPAATRDRALMLTGWAGALRRSELVALNLSDVTMSAEGAELRIRRSKTDKDAAGAVVALPYGADPATCPVLALAAIVHGREDEGPEAPVFRTINRHGSHGGRLSGQAVGLVLKRYAGAAGIDPAAVSGHSLRRGFATEARRSGADLVAVCRHGRWEDGSRAVLGYFADVDRWNDSPLRGIEL